MVPKRAVGKAQQFIQGHLLSQIQFISQLIYVFLFKNNLFYSALRKKGGEKNW